MTRLILLLCLLASPAWAQSFPTNPPMRQGLVPTIGQWNNYFSQKQDVLGFTPVNKAGDLMLGKLTAFASTAASASFNIAQGVAPTTPQNGDMWITSAGLFLYSGGATTGPIAAGQGNPGGSTGQLQVNGGSNTFSGITAGGDVSFANPNFTVNRVNGVLPGALYSLNVGTGLASAGGNLNLTVPVSATNGGTGINNGANTITLGGNFTTSGAFNFTATLTGATNSTFPAGTHNLAALDLADQTVSGGANVTSSSLGTPTNGSTLTIDCGTAPLQFLTNNVVGFTIAAPSNDGSCLMKVTNGASAGTITFSGFTVGNNTGDLLTTTNGNIFSVSIWRINGTSGYRISAHQ
jgi:hypothetical protein